MVVRHSSIVNRSEFLINCPSCNRVCRILPSDVEKSDKLVKIFGMKGLYLYQCDCSTRFNLKLDFRRRPRYSCDFSSFYITLAKVDTAQQKHAAGRHQYQRTVNSVIKDISVDGMGLMVLGRHDIKPGDELLVTFMLKYGSVEKSLERRVVVRSVKGNKLGAEFFPGDKKKPEIGFFLMEK